MHALPCTHPCLAAARLLAPGEGQPAGQGAFALFGKTGRSPRVYCCAGREGVLKAIQVRQFWSRVYSQAVSALLIMCFRSACKPPSLVVA